MRLFVALFLIFYVPISVFSWDKMPHMIVVGVAEHYLAPKAKRGAELLSSAFGLEFSGFDSMYAMAVWQNDPIVQKHFPVLQRAYHSVLRAEDYPFEGEGVVDGNLGAIFSGIEAVFPSNKEAPMYASTVTEKLLNLSLLLHYVAEVHYPFSALGFFEGKPLRDVQSLEVLSPWKKVEAVWSCAGMPELKLPERKFQQEPEAPSAEEITRAQEIAAHLVEEFDGADYEERLKGMDPQEWAKETARIFCDLHKQFPVEEEDPSEEYIEQVNKLSRQQLFLAGVRLAMRMNAGAGVH